MSQGHLATGCCVPGRVQLSLTNSVRNPVPPATQKRNSRRDSPPLGEGNLQGQSCLCVCLILLNLSFLHLLDYNQSTIRTLESAAFYLYVLIYFPFQLPSVCLFKGLRGKYLSPSWHSEGSLCWAHTVGFFGAANQDSC